jgi:hypothetical protein
MIVGRWVTEAAQLPVTCVEPYKRVRPQLRLDADAVAPPAVEVRRTFDNVFRRLLKRLLGETTLRVTTLYKDDEDGVSVVYEGWPAPLFEPRERPTLLYFRDGDAGSAPSAPLAVAAPAWIRAELSSPSVELADPTGQIPVGFEVPLAPERTIEATIEAPVDPEVEVFTLSPAEAEGFGVDFESYIQSHLEAMESFLAEAETDEVARLVRRSFEEVYEPFLAGAGRIHAEIAEPNLTVTPQAPGRVSIELHPESAGEMMLVIGARTFDGEAERVAFSEMIPLAWRGETDPAAATAGHGERHWRAVEKMPAALSEA